MEILTDRLREPDDDNPKGYYEFEMVKKLKTDASWLADAKGKAVKVISALLGYLPEKYDYKIIFMERKMEEILASQKQMLIRRGERTDASGDEELKLIFLKHLQKVKDWLVKQSNMEVLYINYNDLLKDPIAFSKIINQFLENRLNTNNMVSVVDMTLYRQRL